MEYFAGSYDVIVIGAGHAGIEACLAAARLGVKTAVFTINLDWVGNMPCNPSIGGTSKGHLVREIDALGGEMGKAADANTLQSRILNLGKGPAVHSLRAQIDRRLYSDYMKHALEKQDNLDLRGCMNLFFADGMASCAMVYPDTVNGKKTHYYDPWANDQDWALYYAVKWEEVATQKVYEEPPQQC